jgi:hypothetical protein
MLLATPSHAVHWFPVQAGEAALAHWALVQQLPATHVLPPLPAQQMSDELAVHATFTLLQVEVTHAPVPVLHIVAAP